MTRRIPAAIRERWEDRSPALESMTLEQYAAMVERSAALEVERSEARATWPHEGPLSPDEIRRRERLLDLDHWDP
jgi:hypothetical protein